MSLMSRNNIEPFLTESQLRNAHKVFFAVFVGGYTVLFILFELGINSRLLVCCAAAYWFCIFEASFPGIALSIYDRWSGIFSLIRL